MLIACDRAGKSVKNKTGATRCALFQWRESLVWALVLGCVAGRAQAVVYPITFFPGNGAGVPLGGIVGQTDIFSPGEQSAPELSNSNQSVTAYQGMGVFTSPGSTSCLSTNDPAVAKGYSGVYGFKLINADTGQDSGAVLLPDGSVSWQRQPAEGGPSSLRGITQYTKGRWNLWMTAIYGDADSAQSDPDGSKFGFVACPQLQGGATPLWDSTRTRELNSASLKFFVDAPVTGLAAGRYRASISMAIPGPASAYASAPLLGAGDVLSFTVPAYSCSISAPSNVELTKDVPTGRLPVTVTCFNTSNTTRTVNVYVYARAAGYSLMSYSGGGFYNANRLPVYAHPSYAQSGNILAGNGMYIVGNWKYGASCSDVHNTTGAVLFGMNVLGTTGGYLFTPNARLSGTTAYSQTTNVRFRLCPDDLSAVAKTVYQAQATFSLVEK